MSPVSHTKLDYSALLKNYPWILERGQSCILSPDSDGFLCGLLMSHHLDWHIRGFYDGKVLLIEKGINPQNCIFMDMEIFRPNIRSIGQHMVMYDKGDLPPNWSNFKNCISPNNLRGYDFKNNFKLKYPLGTVHLLLSILGQNQRISIQKSAVAPLLYTDGTFKTQFNYPENCLSWLNFLDANNTDNPLQKVFLNQHYSTYELMVELKELFSEITIIGGGTRGGDKIKISDLRGNPLNLDVDSDTLKESSRRQGQTFIQMLANKTQWVFAPAHWSWGPYEVVRFQKGNIKPGKARYNALLAQNPISLAIISRNDIEYTTDDHSIL